VQLKKLFVPTFSFSSTDKLLRVCRLSEREVQQMRKLSSEMFVEQAQDCWFELPRITLHGFCEKEGTAYKALYMHVRNLVLCCSIFIFLICSFL